MRRVSSSGRVDASAYHRVVADRLRALEPGSWSAFGEPAAARARDLHADLLRSAHRLDPVAHPGVTRAAAQAAAALGVMVPVSVYRLDGGGAADATLARVPDEAVVALPAALLGLLTPAELTAVLGHELALHALWTRDDGVLLVADRLLDALALDARTPPVYHETARRWGLATVLAADRGALLACGDVRTVVAALLKTATGFATADPDACLAQAAAIDPAGGVAAGRAHPDTVLRAWALQQHAAGSDERVGTLLGGGLDLEALDLVDRDRLEILTRRIVEAMISPPGMRTAAVLAHARQFFPDVAPTAGAQATFTLPAGATEATRRYLAYVLLDLATVDPGLGEAGLLAALTLAARIGLGDAAAEAVARERLVPAATLASLVRTADAAADGDPGARVAGRARSEEPAR